MKLDVVVLLFLAIPATRWLDLTDEDHQKATSDIRYVYANVAKEINDMYKSINSSRYTFSTRVVKLIITKESHDPPFTEYHPARKNLRGINMCQANIQFSKWLEKKKHFFPAYDVAIAFMKYADGLTGMGFKEGVCSPLNSAVATDMGIYGTSDTAAHKIGHILGAMHDGEGNNCAAEESHIMTPLQNPKNKHKHTFSRCSVKYFEDYVANLTERKFIFYFLFNFSNFSE
ncbi:hypothetical protein HELRODRAFT_177835 [Helobdella robusta]|uniref:Peptidase M12B domain-containing protein n=1 Tax=Helobdella robusta TaxID=6412 RepID=T1FCC4_HELRO|nr:hypothetical protein HELRODRAFT_177835 [Helobdella robusta]ESN97772.1 hypothetical protein HELRODRAFT_177835 [Helobdella robusta]